MNANESRNGQEQRLAALHESIHRAFPAEPYKGKITPSDGKWTPELDDDQALYQALHGRRWTELPPEILHQQPDGYELLTDEAFVAFFAAWLVCSLQNLNGENRIREFLVYAFSPRTIARLETSGFKVNRLRILSAQQRLTLRSLLAEFAEREASAFLRAGAARAVQLIDSAE